MTTSFNLRMGAFALAVVSILLTGPVMAASPVIENLTWAQRSDGSGLVDILFDLSDSDGDSLAVAVSVSDDGGITWNFPCYTLSGDVGPGVGPGPGKAIVWDLAHDAPEFVGEGFQVRVVASDAGVLHTTHSPQKYWIMQWQPTDWSDQTNVEKMAKGDVLVVNAWELWGDQVNEDLGVVARIKAINPDIKILVYGLVQNVLLAWGNTGAKPLSTELYNRTLPYWSYTTTGDTLFNWPGQVVVNLLDPACRRAIVDTYAEFSQASVNQVDGIFWDYFAEFVWISAPARELVDGEPDLDEDGIAHLSDPDERQAFLAAGDSLVTYMREVMGDSFIQVFNGPRAHTDSSFASLGDGMYYEIYPNEVFPDPDLATSLDPTYANNLFRTATWPRTDNGGPYTVLGCIWQNFYVDNNQQVTQLSNGDNYRVVALLTDIYATWLDGGSHTYDWPDVEINLGQPLGAAVIDGVNFSRQFEHGSVEMVMEKGRYPDAFRYVIKCNGVIVEELDVPYHFP